MSEETPVQALMRMTNGYQVSQAIHTAAALGIADQLGSVPRPSDEIASAIDADPATQHTA